MKLTVRYIEAKVVDELKNSDALSTDGAIFRNGGSVNGRDAVPFVELTDDLRDVIRKHIRETGDKAY